MSYCNCPLRHDRIAVLKLRFGTSSAFPGANTASGGYLRHRTRNESAECFVPFGRRRNKRTNSRSSQVLRYPCSPCTAHHAQGKPSLNSSSNSFPKMVLPQVPPPRGPRFGSWVHDAAPPARAPTSDTYPVYRTEDAFHLTEISFIVARASSTDESAKLSPHVGSVKVQSG